MTKIFTYISLIFLVGLLTGCSQLLQTVDLDINSEDSSLQEKFNVVEKTLTIKEANAEKAAPYIRAVLKSGRGENARPIPEDLALKSKFPRNEAPSDYILGIGDTLRLSRLLENNRTNDQIVTPWPVASTVSNYKLGIGDTLVLSLINTTQQNQQLSLNNDSQNVIVAPQSIDETITSKGRIGSDGSVLLLVVGRLEALGKSLDELRSDVRNILIRNGVSPRFQLEIAEFKSQKAYLTINTNSKMINLNDQVTTLKDILTSANVGFKPGVITLIRLIRENEEFSILLRDLYSDKATNINVQSGDHIFIEESSANIITTESVIDNEGYLVFETVGKVQAAGRTLNELKNEFKSLMKPVPDSQNAFQIQVTNFASQKALITSNGKPGVLIPITDIPAKLSEVLTQNGLSIDANNVIQISLKRDGQVYAFSLDDLLASDGPDIYLQPDDHISTQVLPYKENKVFILGGVSPQIFKINPANRETLADILFTSGGPLSASNAKRSEVYLLRGKNPVVAYHLDAQSPTRLIVADAMELRPNDILYVAEQTIISFNRALATIVPLRILLRDIQDENIP